MNTKVIFEGKTERFLVTLPGIATATVFKTFDQQGRISWETEFSGKMFSGRGNDWVPEVEKWIRDENTFCASCHHKKYLHYDNFCFSQEEGCECTGFAEVKEIK